MVHSFSSVEGKITKYKGIRQGSLWYDILYLKEEERKSLEETFKVYIPSRTNVSKLGTSDSFYTRGEALYMTTSIVANAHTEQPILSPIVFILHPQFLLTIRDSEPKPFQIFKKRLAESGEKWNTPTEIFVGLIETVIDRIAELTEKIGTEIDSLSEDIFRGRGKKLSRTQQLSALLTRIGKKGDLAAKINESSRSLQRLLNHVQLQQVSTKEHKPDPKQIRILQHDLTSLLDHSFSLSNKISFLLDASLGYISIEQNAIIKIFTIMSVIFLPPTLIAAIYGMNFKKMPEIEWRFGYLFSLIIMVISAIISYYYFKRKRWL